jgi:hypothetical protein
MPTMTPTEARVAILAGTAPDGLTVEGSLVLIDCTGLTAIYKRGHGYKFYTIVNAQRFFAGCRNFDREQALAHWGSPSYPNRARGDAFVAAVNAAIAKVESRT